MMSNQVLERPVFNAVFLLNFSYPKTSVVTSRTLTWPRLQRKQSSKDCWDSSVTIPITYPCMLNLAWCEVLYEVRFPFVFMYIGVVTLYFLVTPGLCRDVVTESMAPL